MYKAVRNISASTDESWLAGELPVRSPSVKFISPLLCINPRLERRYHAPISYTG